MKKSSLINAPISAVIATLGHTDELVIADAGLPIPAAVTRIDLALTANIPRFVETLAVVLSEMQVESAVVAEEMLTASPHLYEEVLHLLSGAPVHTVSHEEFKRRLPSTRAVVRTGEFTPYANIILVAGVVF